MFTPVDTVIVYIFLQIYERARQGRHRGYLSVKVRYEKKTVLFYIIIIIIIGGKARTVCHGQYFQDLAN